MTGVLSLFPQRVRTQDPCVRWQFVGQYLMDPQDRSRAESYVSLPDKVLIEKRTTQLNIFPSAVPSQK